MSFIYYLYTIVPTRLAGKLIELGLNSHLCAWILDFLTTRLLNHHNC